MGLYGQIVQEIKAVVKNSQFIRFVHERREWNMDAHGLARSSLYKDLGRHVWFFIRQEVVVARTPFIINKTVAGLLKKKARCAIDWRRCRSSITGRDPSSGELAYHPKLATSSGVAVRRWCIPAAGHGETPTRSAYWSQSCCPHQLSCQF